MPGFAEGGGFTRIERPGGKLIDFPGCPMQHVTADVLAWINQYWWFDRTQQTPISLGLVPAGRLDPRWFEAMELIDLEVARIRRAKLPGPKGRR